MLTARRHKQGTRRTKALVGLDIEAASIAAAQVSENGAIQVESLGIAPLEPGLLAEGEVTSTGPLSAALRELFAEHKLARNVRIGIANQRVAVRTMRLPAIEKLEELDTAVRFQAQEQLPMPLDQAVLDYRVVGRFTDEDDRSQMDIVVAAARRDMVSGFIEAVRGAGLRPVGMDLSAFAMIRALAPRAASAAADGAPQPTVLYCNIGDGINLAVARGRVCMFTRVAAFGLEAMAAKLGERRGLTLQHARQWLSHVGLNAPVESIEGDPEIVNAAREVLQHGASRLVEELRLSIEFFGQQHGGLSVERAVVCGPGSVIEGLVERVGSELHLEVGAGRPGALASLDDIAAARLTLPYGLALEE